MSYAITTSCATVYDNPVPTVIVPPVPNVNDVVDVVTYLSPDKPEVPVCPEDPELPLKPAVPADPEVPDPPLVPEEPLLPVPPVIVDATPVRLSNCLEICHNRFSSVPQPICLDGIAIVLLFYNKYKLVLTICVIVIKN
jgi:hypothetical protein